MRKLTESLQADIVKEYENAFVELEAEASKRKVAEEKYTQKEYKLEEIKNTTSLEGLKNKKLSVQNFKTDQLEKIITATPVQEGKKEVAPVSYRVTAAASVINTEKEMEAYLAKIRREMLAILNENKTIIIK